MQAYIMSSSLILICIYKDEMCVVTVKHGFMLSCLRDKVANRWSELNGLFISLYYFVADNPKCLLSCNNDVDEMIRLAASYNAVRVKVEVVASGAPASLSSSYTVSGSCVTSSVSSSEESFLALPGPSSDGTHSLIFGWEKVLLHDGQCFYGGVGDLRFSLQKVAIQTGFKFDYKKNSSSRIYAVCPHKTGSGCNWHVRAAVETSTDYFYITSVCDVHSCGTSARSFRCSSVRRERCLSSDVISKVVACKVRDDPSFGPSDLCAWALNHHGRDIGYRVAWAAVLKARDSLYGDVETSFRSLRSYVEMVKATNPGSVVFLDVDSRTGCFKRMFVAFVGVIRGFNHCRPLLFLDGAHLKFNQHGHLLSATGKDGDDGLYPFCFGVVDSEDVENWNWFLSHMKTLLIPARRMTFMSDRHTGLLDAVRVVFPDAYHSFCTFHINNNLKTAFSGRGVGQPLRKKILHLFHKCVAAPTVDEYEKHMSALLLEGGERAEVFFSHLSAKNWATAHFEGCRYGHTASTLAESFNSWIFKERHLPVLNMVDGIRIKMMSRLSDKRVASQSFSSLICPNVDMILAKLMDAGSRLRVVNSDCNKFEVFSDPTVAVDLAERSCSCGEWQRNGYPCIHVMAVIRETGLVLANYVDPCFLSQSFADSYSAGIHPIPGPFSVENVGETVVLPPAPKKQPGRPRTKRLRSRGESLKPAIQCGRCHLYGHHNKRSCRARLTGS